MRVSRRSKNKRLSYGIPIAIVLIMVVILISNYIGNNEIKYSQSDICAGEGTNDIILKAISIKYPQSQIIGADMQLSMSMGPHWIVKIKEMNGKIRTETFKCRDLYLVEQCDAEFLRNNNYITGEDFNDQLEINQCYAMVSGFYKDVEICKKIKDDEYVKDNCFALAAGLRAPDRWSPSICNGLRDEEAKIGCIKFFETD